MNNQKIKVIVTGASGMVGEGVLHVCLLREDVEAVLVVGRRPCGTTHPKLKEIIHGDFFNLSAIESQLSAYDACFFCLGVSSVGMKEDDYYKLTYSLTTNFAQTLLKHNPGMTFCYISGASTDSSEKGKSMWARVKGKTENELMKMHFKRAYNFRPGVMEPLKGLKNTLSFYKYLGWLIPLIRLVAPKFICKLEDVGNAMVNAVTKGYNKQILEVTDILALSKK
ncbi:MAG: NAD-dependent epimerase/dehydratase family protein [Bacteroidetes bacterium]|nr:NAD-dependent epimerase/dehydratase family protein [Bacteroidota bacterium]